MINRKFKLHHRFSPRSFLGKWRSSRYDTLRCLGYKNYYCWQYQNSYYHPVKEEYTYLKLEAKLNDR